VFATILLRHESESASSSPPSPQATALFDPLLRRALTYFLSSNSYHFKIFECPPPDTAFYKEQPSHPPPLLPGPTPSMPIAAKLGMWPRGEPRRPRIHVKWRGRLTCKAFLPWVPAIKRVRATLFPSNRFFAVCPNPELIRRVL
jgi:hypothetical protein